MDVLIEIWQEFLSLPVLLKMVVILGFIQIFVWGVQASRFLEEHK